MIAAGKAIDKTAAVKRKVEVGGKFGRLRVVKSTTGYVKKTVTYDAVNAAGNPIQVTQEIKRSRKWRCYCDPELEGCGNYKTVAAHLLLSGFTRSCGCLKEEAWKINRTLGPQASIRMVTVKGREIRYSEAIKLRHKTVSEAEVKRRLDHGWDMDKALFTPMLKRTYPSSQDRKTNITVFGYTMTMAEAVRKFGKVSRSMVYWRLDNGWSLEDALTTPGGDTLRGKYDRNKIQRSGRSGNKRKRGKVYR